MKIIKRKNSKRQFKVLRSFYFDGREVQPGEIIASSDTGLILTMLKKCSLTPLDLPEVGTYISLVALTLPGEKTKFECAILEKIELTASQAMNLMLQRKIIPLDDEQWRPYNMRFKKTKRGGFIK